MSQQKTFIVKISSCLSTAVFDCGIYSNCNIYLASTVKLNLVKFHTGTSNQTSRFVPTCVVIQLLVDSYLKVIHRQNVNAQLRIVMHACINAIQKIITCEL